MSGWTELVAGGAFFECPRWHEGRWWVSDFYRRVVVSLDDAGRETVVAEIEGQPSGLGWLPGGDLLIVSMRDQRLLRLGEDGMREHADASAAATGHLNDMLVDATGRAYVGCFGFDLMAGEMPATAPLLRVDPDGSVHEAARDMRFANAMMLEGATLIVAETMAARLTAFTVGPGGALSDRRAWAQLSPEPPLADLATMMAAAGIAPDGCALDAGGHVWAADALGGPLRRIAPGGRIVAELTPPPGLGIFACALGGEDGRTLLACAAPDFLEANRASTREALLLTARVEVPAA